MGTAFLYGSGGGTKAVACIRVTYPSGSTCTCYTSSKTLTAKDTSGTWLFQIPATGSWTVKSTNGTYTKTQTVTVANKGTYSITLAYTKYLYDGSKGGGTANLCTDVTGGWVSTSSSSTIVQNTDHLGFYGNVNDYLYTKNKISTSGYATFNFTGYTPLNPPTTPANYRVSLCTSAPTSGATSPPGEVAYVLVPYPTKKTVSINLSSYQGSYYVVIRSQAASSTNMVRMNACWLA